MHHLQRVLSKQWRASTVVREGDKIKRIPAFWGGLQVLPCFIDSAANSEEDNHNNRPHVENWICLKTLCADGGLQELTGNLAVTDITSTWPSVTLLKNAETRMVTDVTGTLPSVTPLKNAETCMVTDVTALQGKSRQYEKTSSHESADDLNSTAEGELLTDVTRVTTIVTPTFEPSAKPCNNSKICKESHPSEPGTITGSEPEVELTAQTASPIAPRVNWNSGDRVKVSAQYPGAQDYKGERATVVEVWSDGLCRIELDREISALEGKPKKQFNLNVRYLVSESAADSNLNEEELELVNLMRFAVTQSDPLVTDAVKKCLAETCDKSLANRKKVWEALTTSERTVFKALLAELEAQPQPEQLAHAPAPDDSEPKTPSEQIELSKQE